MPHRHQVTSREIGQVRIYMTPGERCKASGNGIKKLLSGNPPLYKEIIRAAKACGLLNVTTSTSITASADRANCRRTTWNRPIRTRTCALN